MADVANFDHHQLRRSLRAARHRIDEAIASRSASDTPFREARSAIDQLEAGLTEHFLSEESEDDGFFLDLMARAPELTKALQELQDEHAPLLAEMRAVAADAGLAQASSDAWERLSGRFEKLSRRLARHENAEDALVADALCVDGSAGG